MVRFRWLWPSYLVQFVLAVLSAAVPVEFPSVLLGELPAMTSDEADVELPELSKDAEQRFGGPEPRQYTLRAESGGFSITGADAELVQQFRSSVTYSHAAHLSGWGSALAHRAMRRARS